MGFLNRIWIWIAGAGAAAIAVLLFIVRWQAGRLEERDRTIRGQKSWIDTTKRIQQAPKADDVEEARKWLREHADE